MKTWIVSIVTCALLSSTTTAEIPKPVRGTRVVLTPPAGFVVADRFPGYMSQETGASIMVLELPAPFAEVAKDFNAEGFKRKGLAFISQDKVTFGGQQGVLILSGQTARGVEFLKWMGIFGDDKGTCLVTASFPKSAEASLLTPLKTAVLGAQASGAPVDPLAGLTFRISPTNDLQLAKVIGNNMLFSKGGVFPVKSQDIPIFIAAASASQGLNIPDKRLFAEARLQKVAKLTNVRVKSTEPISADGLDGFESTADATETTSNANMFVYQVILFDADGYFVMQGIASDEVGRAQLPTMKLMARSFKKATPKS
jgi:hypothetical protein